MAAAAHAVQATHDLGWILLAFAIFNTHMLLWSTMVNGAFLSSVIRTSPAYHGRTAVDLREQRQLEVAQQMAKVKARARPWRAIIALVLAAAAGIVSSTAGRDFESWTGQGHVGSKIVAAGTAAAFCLLATVGILALAGRARQALQPVTGSAHAAVVRYAIVLVGLIFTLVITLTLFKVPVGQLIVGGALTTILIGIAAQQSLSNVFAGLVLLLSRPFSVGDTIQLRSGAMGGLLEGTVTEIGITYLRLDTADGLMSLPNAQVLAAAVSRPAKPSGATAQPDDANGQQSAPATPADAPAAAPGAAADGQQAGPADAGPAAGAQAEPADRRQPAPPPEPQTPGSLSTRAQPRARQGSRRYACVDSYLLTTSVGMRPRSLTVSPFAFAHALTCALCLRCAAVLRFARIGRADALRACDA